MGRFILPVLLVGIWQSVPIALAQCTHSWKLGDQIQMGLDYPAYAATTWDPDGEGPLPELLVVGGVFSMAGNVPANNIAAWDGTHWIALGSGIAGQVWALAVYQGQLIAGGSFETAGGVAARNIARWDGTSWHALAAGVGQSQEYVYEMLEFNGSLIVGGTFTLQIGGNTYWDMARWDGSTWGPMGSFSPYSVGVRALCEFNGSLYVGGDVQIYENGISYHGVAVWDGTSWQPPGPEYGDYIWQGGYVRDLVVVDGELVACGVGVGIQGLVAKWDGSYWNQIGGVLDSTDVRSIATFDGKLYAGGRFDNSSLGGPRFIARLVDNNWQALDGTLGYDVLGQFPGVHRLVKSQGRLFATGDFGPTPGAASAGFVAAWDGSIWNSLGGNICGGVSVLKKINGELIAGGYYSAIGGVEANSIAHRIGGTWLPLGSGINGSVEALASFDNELIAAGIFSRAGGVSASNIARWDGASWQPLGAGVSGGGVSCLAVYNNKLILAGYFTMAGSLQVSGKAAWNGSQWESLEPGPYNIKALAVFHGDLIAGYTESYLNQTGAIAKWDGTAWAVLGGGVTKQFSGSPSVSALTVYDGSLIVGGYFNWAGPPAAHAGPSVAGWDGSSWSPIGSSPFSYEVFETTVHDGELFANGSLSGSDYERHLERWDGSTWSDLQSPPFESGCISFDGELLCRNFDHWGPDGPVPSIHENPYSPLLCQNSTISLHTSATGDGSLSCQWQKNGQDLTDSSSLFGTQTDTLVFANAQPADSGSYTCVVKLNNCTQATTNTATLTVYPGGSADGSADGHVDARDIQPFIDAITSFAPLSANVCAFDLTGEGIVNIDDLAPFVTRLLNS